MNIQYRKLKIAHTQTKPNKQGTAWTDFHFDGCPHHKQPTGQKEPRISNV